MQINKILFSKEHICSPFTHQTKRGPITLSTAQKAISVASSILIGAATVGIGGAVAFYVITAVMKDRLIQAKQPHVRFDAVRARQFNENQPANAVAKINSFEMKRLPGTEDDDGKKPARRRDRPQTGTVPKNIHKSTHYALRA